MRRSIFLVLAVFLFFIPASALGTSNVLKPPLYSFPTYGNIQIGDCAFAAAADWTIIHYNGFVPREQEVRLDFYEAGGTIYNGISAKALFNWWAVHGVGGHKWLFEEIPSTRRSVEEGVYHQKALIAWFHFRRDDRVGLATVSQEGNHLLIIDGYEPTGPYVTTWGFTASLSWEEWERDIVRIYSPTYSLDSIIKHHRIKKRNFKNRHTSFEKNYNNQA